MSATDSATKPTPPLMRLDAMPCSFSFLSVCSGIEAASVAWEPLGWKACAFAEIEKFPSAVLAHHWPETPNLGDMTKHNDWPDTLRPNLIVGGTPCQAFSVAGLRKGLADPRGNLTLVYLSLLAQYQPAWVVWENVPGVLSDKTGAFGAFLGGLGELGYGFAYRVLDAQYYGVAQRRRRVFVVGYLGDWRRAAAVLFERESLRGDSAPRREAGQGVAGTFKACAGSGGWSNSADHAAAGYMIPEIANTLQTTCDDYIRADGFNMIAHSLRAEGFDASEDGTGRGTPLVPVVVGSLNCNTGPNGHDAGNFACNQAVDSGHIVPVGFYPTNRQPEFGNYEDCSPSVKVGSGGSSGNPPAVAFAQNTRDEVREMAIVGALAAEPGMKQTSYIRQQMQVRRLTPRECERLQGFPDDHTLIPWRGKMAPDGPRYKALGNSMAVPVMRWIGERISQMNEIAQTRARKESQ